MVLCGVVEGGEVSGEGAEGNYWEVEEMEDESSISSYLTMPEGEER